jgi:Straboviridae/Ackermannviridae/Kyanoviridae exonuclease subunit 1
MKIYIISDFHFGKYSLDSDKWLNNMTSYFYDFLIPFLKKYKKPDDKLFVLGDIFDNRTSIHLKALHAVVKLFEDLSIIIETHVLLGNHDMWAMSDPEVNSHSTIRNINNIYVYEQPKILTLDNTEMLMMPWIHGKNKEKATLEKYDGADLLFCHSDLNGCRTQLYPTRPFNREILSITDFKGYNKVYSGHIHIVQEINNFKFVGSPYHLDRNDVGNTKGIWVYNTKKKADVFIENDFSPEFKKIKIYKDKDFVTLDNELKNTNNFIDLEISNNLLINSPHLRLELDKITNKFKIENIEFIDDVVKDNVVKRKWNYTKDKSIKDVSHEWTDNIKLNDDTDLFTEIELKNKMKEKIEECFTLMELGKK